MTPPPYIRVHMASVVIQLPVADWRMLPHAGLFTLVAINRSSPFQFNITTTRFLHRKTAFADIALPPHGGASSGKWRIQKWLVGAQCNYPHLCLILLADRTKAKCIIDTNIKLYKISVLGTFVLANIALDHTKAVTRNIFRGGGVLRSFRLFLPFLSPPFLPSIFLLFPPPQSGALNPAQGFGKALLASQRTRGEKTANICSHPTRSLGSKCTKMRLQ